MLLLTVKTYLRSLLCLSVSIFIGLEMGDYQHKQSRFFFKGVQLSRAIDSLDEFKAIIAKNIRQYQLGVITPRKGQTAVYSDTLSQTNIHSIKRLNNDIPTASQSYAIIIGAGSTLYSDNSTHTTINNSRATGFSGNPLSIIPFRPNNSPEPYAYIADSSKMGKLKIDGTFQNQGIFPPTVAPSYTLAPPTRIDIDTFTSAGSWTAAGSITAVGKLATITSFATVNFILYDSGSTGWCSVGMSATYTGATEGNRIVFDQVGPNFEVTYIEKVIPGISNTTIRSITYDAGTTGLCTIVLNKNSKRRVQTDGLIRINAAETVKILSTSIGDDDQQSFRCSTTVNHVAGESVTGIDSFRCVTTLAHVAGETLGIPVLQFQGAGTTGVGSLTRTGLTLDLTNISGRPVQNTDEMVFIIRVQEVSPNNVDEIQILLDCGDGTFTGDFFMKSIRPSDFQPTANQSQTTQDARTNAIQSQIINTTEVTPQETQDQLRARLFRRLQKAIQNSNSKRAGRLQRRIDELSTPPQTPIDPPSSGGGSLSSEIGQAGPDQFWVLRFRIVDLLRVGSNSGVGLKNINALRMNFFINASAGVGDPAFQASAWWIGGSYGPDVGDTGIPYTYRFRYRSSSTGARSFPSPSLRSAVIVKRGRVQLTATGSSDTQADKVDWFRFGGSLGVWKYIGTSPILGGSSSFNDDFPDDVLLNKEELVFTDFQPFPIVSTPITGTVNVSGTMVTITSGAVSTSMSLGTEIIINGRSCTLYAPPLSTTKFEVVEDLGTLTGVTLFIPEPLLVGQPLPAMWGPYGEGFLDTVMFACGDPINPGTLYWTNPSDPDSASDKNQLEITSPSEPLLNGFLFNNTAYVFSISDLYVIYPDRTVEGRLTFKSNKTGLGLGLAGRFSFCIGESKLWFVSKDGIYYSEGSTPVSITDDDLYPLFPHDGLVGSNTNGFIAPDFSNGNNLRLSIGDSFLFFDYKGTDTSYYTWLYDINNKIWYFDSYGRQVITRYYEEDDLSHRWLMGASNGKLYSYNGTSDDGIAIACQLRMGCENFGDARLNKIIGEIYLDYDPDGANITVQPGFDNYTTLPASTVLTNTAGRRQQVIDINTGAGTLIKNITHDISWSSLVATPSLYLFDYYFLIKVVSTFRRFTDYDDLGYTGPKLIRGLRIRADTENIARNIRIQYDNVLIGVDLSVQHNGELIKSYNVPSPFMANLVRVAPQDASLWRLYDVDFIYDKYPDLDNIIDSWTNGGSLEDKWLQGVILRADSNSQDVQVIVRSDDGNVISTLTCNHRVDQVKPYTWPPYITHEMRLEPQGDIRIIDAKWVYEPEPELTNYWVSQPTGHGLKGFQHLKDIYIAIRSTVDLLFRITIDGTNYDYNIANTAGVYRRIYLPLQAVKGKVFQYSLTPLAGTTGFRVYEKDFSARVKEWGSDGEYLKLNPIGHIHNLEGATI